MSSVSVSGANTPEGKKPRENDADKAKSKKKKLAKVPEEDPSRKRKTPMESFRQVSAFEQQMNNGKYVFLGDCSKCGKSNQDTPSDIITALESTGIGRIRSICRQNISYAVEMDTKEQAEALHGRDLKVAADLL